MSLLLMEFEFLSLFFYLFVVLTHLYICVASVEVEDKVCVYVAIVDCVHTDGEVFILFSVFFVIIMKCVFVLLKLLHMRMV